MAKEGSAEATIRDIKRKTRRKYSTEEKIRIVIEGLRGEQSIAELCRREGIAEGVFHVHTAYIAPLSMVVRDDVALEESVGSGISHPHAHFTVAK